MSTLLGFLALAVIVAVAVVALRRGRWHNAYDHRRDGSSDNGAYGAAALVHVAGSDSPAGSDCGPADGGGSSAGDCGGGGGGD